MQTHATPNLLAMLLSTSLVAVACNALTGLNDFEVQDRADGGDTSDAAAYECLTNQECTDRATAEHGAAEPVPAVCVKPEHRCVELITEDCTVVTGDYLDDDAIVLGSLFSTQGSQAATNIPRQQSAMLAIEQINAVGGVPAALGGEPRPLVLVSCDEATDLMRAGGHLVDDLHVPAIVGPNTSQDTLKVSTELTVPKGTVVMTPTAVASSITALIDRDLTWLMVPSDVQRAGLMITQIGELETTLAEERGRSEIKLGIVFRDDALGVGTRTSLNAVVINGKPISDPVNLGNNVQIDGYDFTQPDQAAIVAKYVEFAPDIVVLAGTAEAITKVMVPLEEQWAGSDEERPHYVLIDSVKVPELIMAAGNAGLRRRIRGTGITPGSLSAPVYNAFKVDYQLRFPGSPATISGMGPAYDATYAIAFALAATRDLPVSGASVAQGLRMLSGGPTRIEIGSTKILSAFQKLAAGERIEAIGTFAPLEWNADGAVVGSTIEIWCIGVAEGTPVYESSGLTFDIKTETLSGTYAPCEP